MKGQNKTPEKELSKMETSKIGRAQNTGYKDAPWTYWETQQHKKIQSEKDTLIEIKNNLQRINSRVDEAENQISDLEQKEA